MKNIINKTVSAFLIPLLWFYEKYLLYRIRDAWGKVHLMNIKNKGRGNSIVGYSRFLDPQNLHLGQNIEIGYNCFFFCKGGIFIDDFTIISRNVTIYSSNHNYRSEYIPFDESYVHKPVRIGRGVWIGMNVCILPGVTVGDGAIIGMGSVVRTDVNPGEIIAPPPSAAINKRDMDAFTEAAATNRFYALKFRNN